MSRPHRFVPDQHEAVTLRADLEWLADSWTDLLGRLGAGQVTPDGQPRPASRNIGLVINERVSELMGDVTRFAWDLAAVVAGTSALHLGRDPSTPALLLIAARHVGSFTAHEDEELRRSVPDRAAYLRREVKRAAYPDGVRTIHLEAYRCPERLLTEDGALPCPGYWTIRPLPSGGLADMICSADPEHRVPPYRWMRDVRRWNRLEETAEILAGLIGSRSA